MRAVFKLFVLIACVCFGAPCFAASREAGPPPPSRPAGYIFLRDWAARNGLSLAYNAKDKSILMTNRWARLDLANDSRHGEINGVSVWLSFPISAYEGKLIINQRDVTTLLDPVLFPKRPAKKIRIVAIDAGHGGKDPGYQIGGQQEKKYTLLLAQEVQDRLADAGVKTYMTRRSDKFIDLADRAALAESARADMFVSLHFNCAPDPAAKGVETFCVTPFGTESTNGGEPALRNYPGNRFDAQSALLAYEVQRSITRSLDLADRGVRRAGFVVLRRAAMPGILIEGGFMSNTSDGKKVFNDERRKELARAIVDGILAFQRTMERNGAGR
jgi:N-acetylmuramoyl-L-alanine amidase